MPFLDGLLKCCFDVVLYWRLRKDKYQEKCTCTEGGHDSTCFGRRTHIPTLVDVHLCLRGEHCYAVHCFNNTVETVRKCCFYPPLVFPLRSLSILLFSPGYLRSHICVHVLSAFTTDSLHFSSSARCSCLVEHRHPGTYAEKHACTHTRARTKQESTIFKRNAEYNLFTICLRLHSATHSYGNFFVEVFVSCFDTLVITLLGFYFCEKVYGDVYGFGC